MTAEPKRHGNTRIFPAALDPKAVGIVQRLNEQGYESYLVGGCVRDLLLGHIPKDFDVSTAARPRQIRRVFRNCRIIGRRFKLAHVHFGEQIIEVATFRRPPGEGDGDGGSDRDDDERDDDREASDDLLITRDNDYGTAEQDALRRDFTINALLYDVQTDEVLDWVGGVDDIEKRLLRAIGEPRVRLAEDPVRMLRAVKFASRLGLDFEPELDAAMSECAPLIEQSAPPRVLEEIFKLLTCGHAKTALTLLTRFGLFAPLLPELAEYWSGRTEQLVAVGRALDQLDGARRRLPNGFLLAALCHDPWRATLDGDGVQEAQVAARELLTPLALRMSVPRRDIAVAKQLLTLQARFERKRSGRRARLGEFLGKPSTQQGLEFLYLRSLVDAELAELHADWTQRLAALHPGAARRDDRAESADGDDEQRPAKRRRRRRRRGGRNRRRRDDEREGESTDDGDDEPREASSRGRGDGERARDAGRRGGRDRAGDAAATPASDEGRELPSPAKADATTDAGGAATPASARAATAPSDSALTDGAAPRSTQRGLGGRLKKWVRKVLGGPEAADAPTSPSSAPGDATDASTTTARGGDSAPHASRTTEAGPTAGADDDAADGGAPTADTDGARTDDESGDGERKPRRRRRSRGGRRRRGRGGASRAQDGESTQDGAAADDGGDTESDDASGDDARDDTESSSGGSGGRKRRRRGGRRRGGAKRGGSGGSDDASEKRADGDEAESSGGGSRSRSRGSGKKRRSGGGGGSSGGGGRSDKRGEKRSRRARGGTRDEFDPGGHTGTDDIGGSVEPQHNPEDVEDVFDW